MYIVDTLVTGLGTLTLQLYPRGSATIFNTGGDTAAEDATRKGYYEWTVSETLVVGTVYDAIILTSGAVKVGGGEVRAATGDTRIAITPGQISSVTVELSAGDLADIVASVEAGISAADFTVSVAASAVALTNIDTLGNLTIHRGDTFSATITDQGDMSNYSKVYFNLKHKYDDAG